MSRKKRGALRPVSVKGGTADVYIEGVIGEDVTAADVREQIAAAKGATSLRVHINSEGGIITEGMAIYAALRSFRGKKVGIVEGLAASMASVVLMACDERIVSKGAFVMIHNPSGGATGGADDLRSTADLLDKMREEILDIYEARSGASRDELEKLVDAETYFTADEAKAFGLADSVATDAVARVRFEAVARLNPEKIPESLRALAQKEPGMKLTEEEAKALSDKCAALEAENAALKAASKAKAEEDPKHDTRAEEDGDDDGEEDEPESEDGDDDKEEAKALLLTVKQLTGKRSAAEAHGAIVALANKAGTAIRGARAERVSKLIAEGKLLPAMKQWALKASDKAFGAYVASVGENQVAPIGKKHTPPAGAVAPTDAPTADEVAIAKLTGRKVEDVVKSRGAVVQIGLRNMNEDN